MPKTSDNINKELDDLITGLGFESVSLDSSGQELPTSDSADVIQFHFHADGEEYGTVTVSIDGLHQLIVYYDDRIADSPDYVENGISWFELLKKLKRFALTHQLAFQVKNSDRLRKDMKRRTEMKKMDESIMTKTLLEAYWGNRTTSWTDPNPQIKIVIKHNRKLEEGDARFRNIDRIFLENEVGERVLVPTTKPSQARMFARHLAEGGQYNDDRWGHLKEICEDIGKLGGFIRATKHKREQFNESIKSMISEAESKYMSMRESIKQLQSSRGYQKYFESYKPIILDEDSADNVGEFFVENNLDTRIESALPVLAKYDIRIRELAESSILENWADSLINEYLNPDDTKLDNLEKILNDSELTLGPSAINAISELKDIIENDDLNAELKDAADNNPNVDARPIIISWMSRQDNPKFMEIINNLEDDTVEEPNVDTQQSPPESEPASEPATAEPETTSASSAAGSPELPDTKSLPTIAEDELKSLLRLIK